MSFLDGPHCYVLYDEQWSDEPGRKISTHVIGIYSTVKKARQAGEEYEKSMWPDGIPENRRTQPYLYPIDWVYVIDRDPAWSKGGDQK